MIPGEIMPAPGDIELNAGCEAFAVDVANTGDRPIQVGSHYHFAETNAALVFDRVRARGCRLAIPAGTAVRFEPGQHRTVLLTPYRGARIVYGFTGAVMGSARPAGRGEPAMKLDRRAYAQMYGPTTGDRVRLADTELVLEVERDLTIYGEEVKFGGGKVIRDGMGQSQRRAAECADTVITNALVLDWWGIVKCDLALKNGRIACLGKAGNPDVQPGVDIVIGAGTEIIAGEGHDRHRRRHRLAHPFHLPAADRRCARVGRHHDARRRHGSGDGDVRDDVHARAVAPAAHARSGRRVPHESRLSRQGQRKPAAAARRADRGRRDRAQAARGLGHDARRDRRRPARCRCARRAGGDPHRHAQRVRLRRDDARGDRGPHDPHLSHRRRGRRSRAGHHPRLRRAQRPAVVDQSHAPLHRQHDRRASRHADGVPSPRPGHSRGHRLRRIAHPPRDHRRRGHPARSRRVLDALVRLAGDGPRRRGDHPDLADRAQDEAAARGAAGGRRAQRQLPRASLHRQVHDQSRDRARHRARSGIGRTGQAGGSRALEAGVLRRQALRWC